jgi:dipeptidyl-peptidase-3
MLKTLISSSTITISHSQLSRTLTVHVDRTRITTHGKPALGDMLLRLHIYRCTADVVACRKYYEELSNVEGEYLAWRETVLVNKPPPLVFVQANTFLVEGGKDVMVREYEESAEGVVESWVERRV